MKFSCQLGLAVALSIAFVSTVSAGGGRVSGRDAHRQLPAAMLEYYRADPVRAKHLHDMARDALDPEHLPSATDRVSAAIRRLPTSQDVSSETLHLIGLDVLRKHGFSPALKQSKGVAVHRVDLAETVLGTKLHQILRINAVIEETAARVVGELDGADALRGYLQQAKVPDEFVADVSEGFDYSALVREVVFSKPVELLRVFGDRSKPLSHWYFCCSELNPTGSRDFAGFADASGLALPDGNSASNLALVTIAAGTRALIGSVANRYGRPGRNVQFYLPDEVLDFQFGLFVTIGGAEFACVELFEEG